MTDEAEAFPRHRRRSDLAFKISTALVVTITLFVVGGALLEGAYAPLAIVVAIVPITRVVFACLKALRWEGSYPVWLGVAIIFLLCAVFRLRDLTDKSIDGQIAARLACLGLMGATVLSAMFAAGERRHRLYVFRYWILFLFYQTFSSLISIKPFESLVETGSHIATFLFLFSIDVILGSRILVRILVAACLLLCLASIVVYFTDPGLGRMTDWSDGALVSTARLQGIFGTANAAGAAGALGLLFTIYLSDWPLNKPLSYIGMLPFLFCLIASNNRMAVFALGVGMLCVALKGGQAPLKLAVIVLVLAIGVLLLENFSELLFSSVSRSGSADEITSGTGRTRIWAVVIDLWSQRPLLGYGAGSARYILPIHPMLFKAAVHAHDMYLNILFESGLIGLALFLVSLFQTLRQALADSSSNVIALLVFFCIYGITEPTLGGFVSFVSIGFYATLILASRRSLHVQGGTSQRLFPAAAARADQP